MFHWNANAAVTQLPTKYSGNVYQKGTHPPPPLPGGGRQFAFMAILTIIVSKICNFNVLTKW